MKKIRPLTLLTKLATLTNLTGKEKGQALSNKKTLSTDQGELISGCGIYEPNDPRVKGATSDKQVSSSGTHTAKFNPSLNDDLSSKVSGGLVVNPAKVDRFKKLNVQACKGICGSGPWKPVEPQVARLVFLGSSKNNLPGATFKG
ncbi:hypothetical protein L1285_14505 [Pseudoalteromonas sp. DL2-H2.2]|uniref:hypothetical protein n=1 Tax=Pseudoalteromonas sp. DL2-H2.2 TaxID=2908889 RepID=UPI001F33672B|nr:hypothetical protein [Pseudoalteromonas sp. DL2-H2.2]MCF2909533.1 hypothetical protein [Pseudoalteromonas sp. DL2-H2.2]